MPALLRGPRKQFIENRDARVRAVKRAGTQAWIDTVDNYGPVGSGVQLAQPKQVQEFAGVVAVHAVLLERVRVVHAVEDVGGLVLLEFGPEMNLGGDDGPADGERGLVNIMPVKDEERLKS